MSEGNYIKNQIVFISNERCLVLGIWLDRSNNPIILLKNLDSLRETYIIKTYGSIHLLDVDVFINMIKELREIVYKELHT